MRSSVDPADVVVDGLGNIYVSGSAGLPAKGRVRRIDSETGIITTVAGDGTDCTPSTANCGDGGDATMAQFSYPWAMALDGCGSPLRCRLGQRSGESSQPAGRSTNNLHRRGHGELLCGWHLALRRFRKRNGSRSETTDGSRRCERWLIVHRRREPQTRSCRRPDQRHHLPVRWKWIRVPQRLRRLRRWRTCPRCTSRKHVFRVKGTASSGIAIAPGDDLVIAAEANFRIRKVNASTLEISTLAGSGWQSENGEGTLASSAPIVHTRALAVAADGGILIADFLGAPLRHVVRRIDPEHRSVDDRRWLGRKLYSHPRILVGTGDWQPKLFSTAPSRLSLTVLEDSSSVNPATDAFVGSTLPARSRR